MKNFDRYGSVDIDKDSNIIAFNEKRFTSDGLINGGIYLISKDIFSTFKMNEKFSFEEFFQANFKALRARANIFDGYFIYIGIPQDYQIFIDIN